MSKIHAFEFLAERPSTGFDVAAVFGNDATLRSWVLHALCGDADVTQVEGESTHWSDLRDDLATASLFDLGEKRAIIIRGADKFLSDHRAKVENYIAHPGSACRLILELDAMAANTRVYKSLSKDHLLVACGSSVDTKQGVTAAGRRKFLTGYIASRHDTSLSKGAADAMVEMVGDDIGMLDTELAKLALYLERGKKIDEDMVRDLVAGWQGKTVWQITDAMAVGDAAEALRQLDKLFSGGQKPISLLPQIAWSLRRFAMATAMIEHWERSGRSFRLEDALAAVGVRPYDMQQAKTQLRGLGRTRARQLLPWLLDADLRLKGTHSADGRDRFLLEQLVVRLARRDEAETDAKTASVSS